MTTTELLVQRFLRSGKTLSDLKAEHGVYSRVLNGKISLAYDQIEAKQSDPLACECRGLILRENIYDLVAVPFFRFFNYGEIYAVQIDWSSANYLEKLDGTLIITYYDIAQDRWMCATRSCPEAEGQVQDTTITFANLVDIAIQKMTGNEKMTLDIFMRCGEVAAPNIEWRKFTFCFELCTLFNRIVCEYNNPKIVLIGARRIDTLQEVMPNCFASLLGTEVPKEYSFATISDMVAIISSWNPKEHEGVVVRDSLFQRIKVKNPAYEAFNHMRDSLISSWRGCVEVVLLGHEDNVAPMMPEVIGQRIHKIKDLVNKIFAQVENDWNELKSIDDMKAFAQQANLRVWSAPLFAIKRGKTADVRTFIIRNITENGGITKSMIDTVLGLCEKMDPELKTIK